MSEAEQTIWQRARCSSIIEQNANAGTITCLQVGPKSSGVVAVAGIDKKLNIYTIGYSTTVLSLNDFNSPIESMGWEFGENILAGGCQNGTIKVWDLNKNKGTLTLNGHRSSCLSLNFAGTSTTIFASSSLDTNVKMWDTRSKSTIYTLKAHKASVKRVKYTPDAKYLISGDEAGIVKIWDVGSGKMVASYEHGGAITDIDCHAPTRTFATSSKDKTVKIYDCDTLKLQHIVGPEATPIRCITFHYKEPVLFSASQDLVKVIGIRGSWETHDLEDMDCSKLTMMVVPEDKHRVVGFSCSGPIMSAWGLDLKCVRPFNPNVPALPATGTAGGEDLGSRAVGPLGAGRNHPMALTRSTGPLAVHGHVPTRNGDGGRVGPPSTNVTRALCRDIPVEVFVPPPPPVKKSQQGASKNHITPTVQPQEVATSTSKGAMITPPSRGVCDSDLSHSLMPSGLQGPMVPDQASYPQSAGRESEQVNSLRVWCGGTPTVGEAYCLGPLSSALPEPQFEPPTFSRDHSQARDLSCWGSAVDPPFIGTPASFMPSNGQETCSQSIDRKGCPVSPSPCTSSSSSGMTDLEFIAHIIEGHEAIQQRLSRRQVDIDMVRSFLSKGDVRGALSFLRQCQDLGTVAPILAAMSKRPDILALDHLSELVATLEGLTRSSLEQHWVVMVDVLQLLLKAFGSIIQETCARKDTLVDLQFEQRKEKCELAKMSLQGLLTQLGFVQDKGSHQVRRKVVDLVQNIEKL